jgi:hypothetical protein
MAGLVAVSIFLFLRREMAWGRRQAVNDLANADPVNGVEKLV